MRKICAAIALGGVFVAPAVHAQSAITLYGLIDMSVMHTSNITSGSSHGSLWHPVSANINGSRFGLRGTEDLGGGIKAVFVLENGFNVETGKFTEDGRLFGRQAYVGLGSDRFGTLALGRQYYAITDYITPLSGVADTFGAAGFMHPFENDDVDHSARISNAVKYRSKALGGFAFEGMYAFSNSTDFAAQSRIQWRRELPRWPF